MKFRIGKSIIPIIMVIFAILNGCESNSEKNTEDSVVEADMLSVKEDTDLLTAYMNLKDALLATDYNKV